jgi:hypothetical protein
MHMKSKCEMTCSWFDKNDEENYESTNRPKKPQRKLYVG